MKPLFDNVVVKITTENKTESGLILSDSKKNKGEVLHIGDDVKNLKVGDLVIFKEYAPTYIEDDVIVVSETDILVII